MNIFMESSWKSHHLIISSFKRHQEKYQIVCDVSFSSLLKDNKEKNGGKGTVSEKKTKVKEMKQAGKVSDQWIGQ